MISVIYIGQKVSFWVKASDFTMEKKIVLDLNRTPLQSDDEQDEDLVLWFLCFGFFFFFKILFDEYEMFFLVLALSRMCCEHSIYFFLYAYLFPNTNSLSEAWL